MGQKPSHLSPVYVDNVEFFVNASNIIYIPFANVSTAFNTPASVNKTSVPGFGWTKPFPGSSVKDGHEVHLTVAHDVPVPEHIVQNSTTALSSLTFSIPGSMSGKDGPLPMDPSWYICRHIFISTKPQARQAVERGDNCGFLSDKCHADLRSSLTKNWGEADDLVMCSSLAFDPIPESCRDSYGHARQDVMGSNSITMSDINVAPLLAIDH
ncbi:Uncharacterized protein TPAR_03985 [Tolypocladium paradoxum]|uniref:Uncharacterized protein n=1 Tax=Tolypocladium paradoxum TaxID=94208 RepID=A0A2S4L053_9HYPO|nr:Uncharacterized protein TPAR_03985 [Tolypocladium paradoxum]